MGPLLLCGREHQAVSRLHMRNLTTVHSQLNYPRGVLFMSSSHQFSSTIVAIAVATAIAASATGVAHANSASSITRVQSKKHNVATLSSVVITGTLIQGVAPVGTAVTTITTKDILNSGATTTQGLLATNPLITSNFNTTPPNYVYGSGTTASNVNIHNIPGGDADTTLVLMNGHDLVGAGVLQTSPDIGMIPPSVLKSVQIVPNGGDAIYGADAVGGIVNLITRKGMKGVRLTAHYGWADGYSQDDASITFGNEWRTGSYIFSVAHQNSTPLLGSSRSYYTSNLSASGGPNEDSAYCALTNVIVNNVTYAAPYFAPNTENLCNPDKYSTINTPQDQNTLYFGMREQLSQLVKFSLTAHWTQRSQWSYVIAGSGTGTITNTNPYFIPVDGATSETVDYNFSSVGGPYNKSGVNMHDFGITPSFQFTLPDGWNVNWVTYLGRNITDLNNTGPNGDANAAALAGTTTTTALDPYDLALTNPSVIYGILHWQNYFSATQSMLESKVTAQGGIADLPGGEAHLAVGAQYQYISDTGVDLSGPPGIDYVVAPYTGTHEFISDADYAAYGELMVPIIGSKNRRLGIRSLIVDVQGRIDHYVRFGSTVNPKFGIDWTPMRGLTIHGTYGTSFVAPSLEDLSGSLDTNFQVYSTSVWGPGPFNTRPSILLAGGGHVRPMTSDTYTVGFTARPTWLPGSKVRITYWYTKVKHEINIFPFYEGNYFFNNFPGAYIINPTLSQALALAGNEPIVGFVTSKAGLAALYDNPTTTPYAIFDAERTNLGALTLKGVDFDAQYIHHTSFGELVATAQGTYLLSETEVALDSNIVTSLFPTGISRLVARGSVGDQYHRWFIRFAVDYSSRASIEALGYNQAYIGSYHPVNALISYRLKRYFGLKHVLLTFKVNNIANEAPSYENNPPGIGIGYPLGRFFNIGVDARF